MSIGAKIREARKVAGLTQVELAQKTSLSRSYIGDIEKDRYNPSLSTLDLIAKATGVALSALVDGDDVATPPAPPASLPPLTPKDERQITRDLENMVDSLNGAAAMSDDPEDEEDREMLRAALLHAMTLSKRMAKKKFTPKKYRNED